MAEGLLCMSRPDDDEQAVLTPRGGRCRRATRSGSSTTATSTSPPAATGELLARGPYTLRGYYNAPGAQPPRVHRGRVLPHR